MTSFDGNTITYDACGNPLTYKGNTLTWERGRLLSQYGNVTFQYDGEGFRRKKVVGNDTVTYYYQDGKLLAEKHDIYADLYFVYNGDEIVGFVDNNDMGYHYRKDVFGNVVAIVTDYGLEVATYTYDAWGNCTIGINVNGMAELNPIRYRGYYYDKETNLYYLQTRYYDPSTGRFISPDTVNYLDPETIHGLNLYAYCGNNPVMYVDPSGHEPEWLRFALVATIAVSLVVMIAAVTATTGGLAAPVLASAVIGAGLSGGMSATVQWFSTGGQVNWWQVATDATIGAVTGALGGSTLGPVGMAIFNGLLGFGGSLAGNYVSGTFDASDPTMWLFAIGNGAIGGLLGYTSGGGAQHGINGTYATKYFMKEAGKGVEHQFKEEQRKLYRKAMHSLFCDPDLAWSLLSEYILSVGLSTVEYFVRG